MASTFTVRTGSIAGIPLRVHLLLPGFMLYSLVTTPGYATAEVLVLFASFWGVLVGSVLLHELGHAFASRRHNVAVHDITLWILGGLTCTDATRRPKARLAIASGGLWVNAGLIVAAGAAMGFRDRALPGLPSLEYSDDLLLLLWNMNWVLLLFNLLPGVPFDGGAILEVLLWRKLGVPKARLVAIASGGIIAAGLVFGGMAREMWILTIIGFANLHAVARAWQELKETGLEDEQLLFGAYDFSNGNTSLEDSAPEPGAAERRKSRERAKAEERARREAAAREKADRRARQDAAARLDGLLERIAEEGIGSLSPEEKEFLNEESRRLRALRNV